MSSVASTKEHEEWRARILRALAELRPDPRSLERRSLDELAPETNVSG